MEITEEKLQQLQESHYLRGQRSALIQQLHNVLRSLSIPYDSVDAAPENLMTIARLTMEREDAISALRSACDDFGDNEWDENLYISDVINKHLVNYLDSE